jgi:Peptidase family M28
MLRVTLIIVLITGFTPPGTAQTAAPLHRAAATITAADVQRRINIIADDSMMGRNTPSPGLEKTAQYVADQFKMFGLKPGGEHGTYFQRYVIAQRRISPTSSHVGFLVHGKQVLVDLGHDARFAFGTVPADTPHAPAVLLGGAYTGEDARQIQAKGKAVLVVMDYRKPITPVIQQAVGAVVEGGAVGIILLSNRDSATFAQRVATQAGVRVAVEGGESFPVPVVEVHERAVGEALAEAGIKADDIRASTSAVIRDLPDLTIGFGLEDQILDSTSAPNTIGILEGSDPKLKDEYLVFSAHMDHVGTAGGGQCQARGGDTICNGADDDGSGTVSVVELAEAFSQPGARPKRSVIFMTVSGEEKGLWGSRYFSDHPTVPLAQVVADLNIDMVGRNWRDTIVAIGEQHSDLGATLDRVGRQHPELRMTPIDDRWPEENFYFRSDHYNFARKGVPILFFFNGTHPDYHEVSDSPDKIDSEKQSRIAQLLFYLGQDIANAKDRPKWNPESYTKIVEQKPAT